MAPRVESSCPSRYGLAVGSTRLPLFASNYKLARVSHYLSQQRQTARIDRLAAVHQNRTLLRFRSFWLIVPEVHQLRASGFLVLSA